MSEHPIVADTEAMVTADNAMVNEALAKWEKARAELVILSAKVKDIMDTTTTREPLLSEAEVERMLDKHDYRDEMDAMKELWRFYEAKITSGELIIASARPALVIIPVKRADVKEHVLAHDGMDNAMDTYFYNYIDFCPSCGARIIP